MNLKKQNVSDIVYRQLEDCILSGEWKQGTKIPSENTLASRLGVSRVTIRTAFQRLISMGLIEAKQGGGTYVRLNSEGDTLRLIKPILLQNKPDVKYFLEYRLLIEPEIAYLAAKRATEEQLNEIRKYLELYEQAIESKNFEAIEPNDSMLHFSIALASQNPLIIKTYEIIKDIYKQNVSQIIIDVGAKSGINYHKKIVKAILSRDALNAKRLMRLHIKETINLYNN